MKLRSKTLLVISTTFVCLIGILFALSRLILLLRLDGMQLQNVQIYMYTSFLIASLFFGLVIWLLLDRLVFSRLVTLNAKMNEIGKSQDFSTRLPVQGEDELASLSQLFNTMLGQLEIHEQMREQNLKIHRRLAQIHTAAEISRLISGVLEPQLLLQKVVNLVQERFDLYYVGVFLIETLLEHGTVKYAVLKAGSGEAGRKMVELGHKLPVGGSSMIGWTVANCQARIALDVGKEAVRFNNPHLPLTRSELALPIISGKQVIGAMTVQSIQEEAFDEADITVLQGIADSLATALENARLFSKVEANLEEIQTLHRQYLAKAWSAAVQRSGQLVYTYESNGEDNSNNPIVVSQIPISLRDQVIGNLTLETENPGWTEEENALINAVVVQAALALENARLLEETQRQAAKERLSAQITAQVWASTNIDTILRTTLHELGRSLDASEGVILLEPPELISAHEFRGR